MNTIFVIIQFGLNAVGPSAEQSYGAFFETRAACEQKLLEITSKLGGEIQPSNFEEGFYKLNRTSDGSTILFAERCVKLVSEE